MQVANGVHCVLDSIVHEVWRLVESKGEDEDYALASVDPQNAFNRFSRLRMIDLLLSKVPSLCRFLNIVYARQMPSLILAVASTPNIPSHDRMQLGDPASMLMFCLVVHPFAAQ